MGCHADAFAPGHLSQPHVKLSVKRDDLLRRLITQPRGRQIEDDDTIAADASVTVTLASRSMSTPMSINSLVSVSLADGRSRMTVSNAFRENFHGPSLVVVGMNTFV